MGVITRKVVSNGIIYACGQVPSHHDAGLHVCISARKGRLITSNSSFVMIITRIASSDNGIHHLTGRGVMFAMRNRKQVVKSTSVGTGPHAIRFNSTPMLVHSAHGPNGVGIGTRIRFRKAGTPITARVRLRDVPSRLPFYCARRRASTRSTKTKLTKDPIEAREVTKGIILARRRERGMLVRIRERRARFNARGWCE